MENTRNITKINITKGKLGIGLRVGFVLSIILFFSACTTSLNNPQKRLKNLAYLYNQEASHLHPSYQIYNDSRDSSVVYFHLPPSELFYADNMADIKVASFKLKYIVYQSLNTGGILDSASFVSQFYQTGDKLQDKILKFKIKTPYQTNSFLKITISDQTSKRKRTDYLNIKKQSAFNRQSILVIDKKTKRPVFGNELLLGNQYRLEMKTLPYAKDLMIQKQNLVQEIAFVPSLKQRHSIEEFKADSSYSANRYDWEIGEKGNYLLTFDTVQSRGVLFLAVDSSKNYLHTPTQMLKPLSYLLSPKEYQKLLSAENKKIALDQFWLKTAGNTRLAKQMIQVYYYRTAVANQHFSSYKEGWQTDRGMIYMIYGEPKVIHKSEKIERWIYGSSNDLSLSFDFLHQHHPYCDNHYVLQVSSNHQKSWTQAVDAWRNGRIFSISQ